MSQAKHLPPHALNEWVRAASAELGLEPDTDAIAIVLDLARDVAHDVARPAAPVSAYLLGLAVGRSGDHGSELRERSQQLVALAADWQTRGEGAEQVIVPPIPSSSAVVIVSGGDAVTPFTAPDLACARGLAAGNTSTAIREHLLSAGHRVFTAPAMNARTAVQEPSEASFGAFFECPAALPAHMTIVSSGDIDNAGEHLARFIDYLHRDHGVTEVDWVGHSNGGLFALAASRILGETGSPVMVRSFTAIGTPWEGGVLNRIEFGEVPESECRGNNATKKLLAGFRTELETELGLARQNTREYLLGDTGWLAGQRGVLAGVPVLLIGGSGLNADGGDPTVWPHDGFVSTSSALASEVSAEVLGQPVRRSYPLVHSIFVSNAFELSWQHALTWNTEVLEGVAEFLSHRPRS
jgi:triacylglycerol lipase